MGSPHSKHSSHLPVPKTTRRQDIAYDAADPDSQFPRIEEPSPSEGTPNVLIALSDDAGFGSSSCFDAPCQMPNVETLPASGLGSNRFRATTLRIALTRQQLVSTASKDRVAAAAEGSNRGPHGMASFAVIGRTAHVPVGRYLRRR